MDEKNTPSKPHILVFAGPNGSGKSTIKNAAKIIGTYINADDIKTRSGCTDLEAAQEAERLRDFCLESGANFTFETILSTNRNLELLRRAKQAGYFIESVFILTSDAEINVFRVKARVLCGEHDVPTDKIRSRYHKSLKNLPELVKLCDVCTVFDNTTEEMAVIYRKDEKREIVEESYLWPKLRILELIYGMYDASNGEK
ncbi:hypothetical protein FACS1894200_04870 [Spirochaetia bacterium]|nr:hypothetical protein FACS1894200_04870 [Spirochaetia bacterium]